MCVATCACTGTCRCPKLTSTIIFYSLHFFLRQGLSWNKKLTGSIKSSQLFLGIPCFSLPSAGITGGSPYQIYFYMDSRYANSGPHACMVGALFTETAFQP